MGPRRQLQYAATRCLTFVPCVLARYALVLARLDHVLALAVLALVVLVLAVLALVVRVLVVRVLVVRVLVVRVLVVRVVACAALVQHVPVLALAASLPLANQFGTVEARELVLVGRHGWVRLVGC
jgi:hypothetical protein